MMRLGPQLVEAANRAEVSALLIRGGYRVFTPEADFEGVDLLLQDPDGGLRKTQMKARPTCDGKYRGKDIWMLFPAPGEVTFERDRFLIRYDNVYKEFKRRYKPAKDLVGRSLSTMPKWLKDFLDKAHSTPRKPTKPDRLVGERAVT